MNLLHNERTKLLANALDRASTACFTVGILTPSVGYLYNVSGFRGTVTFRDLLGGLTGWLLAVVVLLGEKGTERAEAMNEYWVLAFVITPAIVVIGAYIAVLPHERSLKR